MSCSLIICNIIHMLGRFFQTFSGSRFGIPQQTLKKPCFNSFLTFFFFLRFYLVFYERHRERGRDIGRGRSRLLAGSLMGDSIPGPQNHTLRQRQMLNCWVTQGSHFFTFMSFLSQTFHMIWHNIKFSISDDIFF